MDGSVARRAPLKSFSCWICFFTLLLLAGCGGKKNTRLAEPKLDSPTRKTEVYTQNIPTRSQPTPQEPLVIRGPMSQEELDRIYRPARPVESAPVTSSNIPAADPDWKVALSQKWNFIVLHHSAGQTGSAAIFHKAHLANGWDGLGYHFVIGNGSGSGDGEVEVGYRWTRQQRGAHAGNVDYNQHGIGICLVGDFENGGRPTPAQMNSLRSLVKFLQSYCGISTANIIGHAQVPGKSTACPGRNFDLNAFRASLGGNWTPAPAVATGRQPSATTTRTTSATMNSSMSLP